MEPFRYPRGLWGEGEVAHFADADPGRPLLASCPSSVFAAPRLEVGLPPTQLSGWEWSLARALDPWKPAHLDSIWRIILLNYYD